MDLDLVYKISDVFDKNELSNLNIDKVIEIKKLNDEYKTKKDTYELILAVADKNLYDFLLIH